MDKLDLFNILVRFLAIKPLKFDNFDYEQARELIKKDREASITFFGEHHFFEDTIETVEKNVAESGIKNGTVYIYIAGKGCSERLQRNMVDLIMNVRKIVVFGKPEDWPIHDPKISFVDPEGIFADNHQRFFIFQSSGYNVALVARHETHEGQERIEAAMTNADDAVALLSQSVGTKVYQKTNEE